MTLANTVESSGEMSFKPGDVIIDEISLVSYTGFKMNLKGVFQNFVIYEDIFSDAMTGSLTIIDSYNLVKNFPIIGAEVLVVSFRTPLYTATPKRLVFRTYNISLLTETAQEATQLVKVEFVSHKAIKNIQTKVSKSFVNQSVSKMVENIYNEYLATSIKENLGSLNSEIDKELPHESSLSVQSGNLDTSLTLSRTRSDADLISSEVQSTDLIASDDYRKSTNQSGTIPLQSLMETFDKRTYVIPYTSPFGAIRWLSSRARAKVDTTMCDYVFFENSNGHHFVPLSHLKKLPAKCTYLKVPKGFRTKDDQRDLETEMRNVLSVSVEKMTDNIDQQIKGMLASSMITHDMTTKTWGAYQYRYDSGFEYGGSHLQKNPLFPSYKVDYTAAVNSCTFVSPKSSYTMSGMVNNNDPEETVLLRRSLLLQTEAVNLLIECWGDSNLVVGDVIEYRPVSKESTKMLDSFEDDYMKGRYLITAIRHQITDREHRMTMTISKDSHEEPLAVKKNKDLKEV